MGLRRLGPFFLPLIATILQQTTPCFAFWWKTASEEANRIDTSQTNSSSQVEYGVDVSFPIHTDMVTDNYAWLPHNLDSSVPIPVEYRDKPIQPLGDRQSFYYDFVDGCVEHFGVQAERCIDTEIARITMNLDQPQSVKNYTELGFKKIKCPEKVFSLIKEFWNKNKEQKKLEIWDAGNTYTNNWVSPTYMVSVTDSKLRGGSKDLRSQIWEMARDTIQEWTGQELAQSSLYGIRVYQNNSILATHVDRMPLVSSAIVNVDQDLDEPWPLEVYGHDGKAYNVTMEPGDMVLYESHSVLHGRPFPLKGRFMANIFIHFEPTGHSLRHNLKLEEQDTDVHEKYMVSLSRASGGHETEPSDLPPYLFPGSPAEQDWRQSHPNGWKSDTVALWNKEFQKSFTGSITSAHIAAKNGSINDLKSEVDKDKSVVKAKDENGWTPLHEGARSGKLAIVKFLIESGADVNATTGKTSKDGGTALWWAKQSLEQDNPVIAFLESIGAMETGPEL